MTVGQLGAVGRPGGRAMPRFPRRYLLGLATLYRDDKQLADSVKGVARAVSLVAGAGDDLGALRPALAGLFVLRWLIFEDTRREGNTRAVGRPHRRARTVDQ